MGLFSINGKLYKAMAVLWDAVKVNFLWLVFSLPIITIGASTVAAFSVTLKMVENTEGHVARQFIQAFKKNWRQGTMMGVISLVVAYCAYLNIEFFNKLEGNPILFLVAGIVIIFIGLVHIAYAFPISARYNTKTVKAFVNSKEIAFKFFFRTLVMWLVVGLLIFVFIFNHTMMFIGVLVGPVSIFLVISSFSMKFFKQIEKDKLSS